MRSWPTTPSARNSPTTLLQASSPSRKPSTCNWSPPKPSNQSELISTVPIHEFLCTSGLGPAQKRPPGQLFCGGGDSDHPRRQLGHLAAASLPGLRTVRHLSGLGSHHHLLEM